MATMRADAVRFTEKDTESGDNTTADLIFAGRGCCLRFPCFGCSDRSNPSLGSGCAWWEKVRTVKIGDGCWMKGSKVAMKVREWSEMVAGPRWKTFIRRFQKNGKKQGKFQYDPSSYALNFDEGHGENGNFPDAEFGHREFAARYASPLISVKSSVDFGTY